MTDLAMRSDMIYRQILNIFLNAKNHYNVRCVKCGEVSGVDVDEISGLIEMIHDTNGIKYLG